MTPYLILFALFLAGCLVLPGTVGRFATALVGSVAVVYSIILIYGVLI